MKGTNKLVVNMETLSQMLSAYLNEYVFTDNAQIVEVTCVEIAANYGVSQATITFVSEDGETAS